MNLIQKHFRIRTSLLILPIASVFMLTMTLKVAKDQFTKIEELSSGSYSIDTAYFSRYVEHRLLREDITLDGFDIKLFNVPFFIRLTDQSHSDSWRGIQSNSVKNATLKVWYVTHLMQDSILYNPNQLEINDKICISLNETKKMNLIALVFLSILTITFIIFSVHSFLTYRNSLFDEDKILVKKG